MIQRDPTSTIANRHSAGVAALANWQIIIVAIRRADARSSRNFRNVSPAGLEMYESRSTQARLHAARAGDIEDCKSAGCTMSPTLLVSRRSITSRCSPYTGLPRFSARPSVRASVTWRNFSGPRSIDPPSRRVSRTERYRVGMTRARLMISSVYFSWTRELEFNSSVC